MNVLQRGQCTDHRDTPQISDSNCWGKGKKLISKYSHYTLLSEAHSQASVTASVSNEHGFTPVRRPEAYSFASEVDNSLFLELVEKVGQLTE